MPVSSSCVSHRFVRRNRYSLVCARPFLITYELYRMFSFRIVSWRSLPMSLVEVPPFESIMFYMRYICDVLNAVDAFYPSLQQTHPRQRFPISSALCAQTTWQFPEYVLSEHQWVRVYRNNYRLSFPPRRYVIAHR